MPKGRFFPLDFGMYTRRIGRVLSPRCCNWCMAIPLLSGSFQRTLSTPGVFLPWFSVTRRTARDLPLTGLRCLNDTCLQPMHMLIDRLPWDGMPVCRGVGDSTSRAFRRHLQRPLHRFLKVSRSSTPQGSLPACALGDVATHIRPATGRRSLFPTPIPASPLVGLTVFLPSFRKERYGLTTFHKIDKDG